MKRSIPVAWLMAGLLGASVVVYAIDYAAFSDLRGSMGFYTLLDIAFIPLNVLIVGLFINRLLAARERDELLHKMNMAVGAFFAQDGNDLIARLSTFDAALDANRTHLLFSDTWTARDFDEHRRAVSDDDHRMDLTAGEVVALRDALEAQRPFVLSLLQNGNLLEHTSFTNMLWAVSHLSEELSARCNLRTVTPTDQTHLERDMARAYGRLLGEWLLYMRHLKTHYPYLFAFAARTNPFDPDARIEVCS